MRFFDSDGLNVKAGSAFAAGRSRRDDAMGADDVEDCGPDRSRCQFGSSVDEVAGARAGKTKSGLGNSSTGP